MLRPFFMAGLVVSAWCDTGRLHGSHRNVSSSVGTHCSARGGCDCDCSWASPDHCHDDDGSCCYACCCGSSPSPGPSPGPAPGPTPACGTPVECHGRLSLGGKYGT